jgi:hypothetical protein
MIQRLIAVRFFDNINYLKKSAQAPDLEYPAPHQAEIGRRHGLQLPIPVSL